MRYSKEDCIRSLVTANEQVDGYLGVNQYRKLGLSPSPKTIENKFGSWKEGKEAAGLKAFDRGGNTKEKYRYNVPCQIDQQGYNVVKTNIDGENIYLSLHRLLAVSEFGIDKVKDIDVHHKNNIPWDNRPSNLELMSRSEHMKHHRNHDS